MWLLVAMLVAFHLVLVNVASAGPLVCVWLDWRASGGCSAAESARRLLARSSLYSLLLGAVVGSIGLAVIWSPAYQEAVDLLASRVKYGVLEYLFSLVLLVGYLGFCRNPAPSRSWAAARGFVLLLLGTNLIYHFPFLLLILSRVAHAPPETASASMISSAEFRSLMMADDILPRAVHFIVASFAVTGAWLFWRADHRKDEQEREAWIRWGGHLAMGPTMLQIFVGGWIVMRLPSRGVRAVMGDDLIATSLLVASVVLAFWLMHLFSVIAIGRSSRGDRRQALIVLAVVIIAMCGVSQRLSRSQAKRQAKRQPDVDAAVEHLTTNRTLTH